MEAFGTFWVMAIAIFFLVLAVLAILMPLFVLRIRNEVILINKKLSLISDLLQKQ
ncbi:MAG: hypothetical protein JXB42_11910 [Deltaproteobacteria bacterium]|nr:hypothetical protein [Deltaproteobacteria bacterium]